MRKEVVGLIRMVVTILVIVGFLLIFGRGAKANELDLKGEYYEKDGCIYLQGNLTEKERLSEQEHYKQRMIERTRQVETEIQREHEIKIEIIKAQAMREYLIAQGMPLREVTDAIKRIRFNQSVNMGTIASQSSSSVGNITSTAYTGTITNSATGGSGTATTTNNNTNTNENTNETDVETDVNVTVR